MRTKDMHTFMQKKNITNNYNKITTGMLYKAKCQIIEHNIHKIYPKQNYSSLLYWYYKTYYI